MRPAILTAAIVSLGWLIWRIATDPDYYCPCCGWEEDE